MMAGTSASRIISNLVMPRRKEDQILVANSLKYKLKERCRIRLQGRLKKTYGGSPSAITLKAFEAEYEATVFEPLKQLEPWKLYGTNVPSSAIGLATCKWVITSARWLESLSEKM